MQREIESFGQPVKNAEAEVDDPFRDFRMVPFEGGQVRGRRSVDRSQEKDFSDTIKESVEKKSNLSTDEKKKLVNLEFSIANGSLQGLQDQLSGVSEKVLKELVADLTKAGIRASGSVDKQGTPHLYLTDTSRRPMTQLVVTPKEATPYVEDTGPGRNGFEPDYDWKKGWTMSAISKVYKDKLAGDK